MSLSEYRRKRNFRVTSEPRGKRAARRSKFSFVVQKHAASHLHYDFRLEVDGVLKSWAVPKGPSLDPSQKRLAMQVEDHPLEYGDFEGVIPHGEYGGGTVMLWDRGTWEPPADAATGLLEGHLKFTLHGEKLRGGWMLVRRGGKHAAADERHWFLFKERDEFAEPGVDVATELPRSVATGRDLDAIAAQADRVWGPQGKLPTNRRAKKTPAAKSKVATGAKAAGKTRPVEKAKSRERKKSTLAGRGSSKTSEKDADTVRQLLARPEVKPATLPRQIRPALATLVKVAPASDEWLHEIKFDGYRMFCRIDDSRAQFISRNNQNWTSKFPELAAAAVLLPVETALFDGEVVALDRDGTSSFQRLQNVFRTGRSGELLYYVFDVLHLNGRDVTGLPLEVRKQLLASVVPVAASGAIRYAEHIVGDGPEFFRQASLAHLEGIVSKRRDRPYRSGRGLDWLKVKSVRREEFVIGGFTLPGGARQHFGALLLGYYNPRHKLVYAGRVGTGFDERTLSALHKRLKPLVEDASPFVNLEGNTGQARGVRWVRPWLVAQIEFSNWTQDRLLRHPSFQDLREDKPAAAIVRDEAISISNEPQTVMPSTKTSGRGTSAVSAQKAKSAEVEVAGVRLSHPDKVLYPDQGITKLDLARYYEQIAEWMLPHLANRPIAMVRCPAGSGKKCFFQKHPGPGTSEVLRRVKIKEKNEIDDYLVVDDVASLVSLVQMGVLEIHVWGSRTDKLERPDRLTFDLDPDPAVDWPRVVAAAHEVRLFLQELGLISFLKTTGGKGLHLVVPIERRTSWDEAKAFCRAVAERVAAAAPDRYIATMSKAARRGKIFIDYLRNDRGATVIAAYSTRARTGAPVSLPIAWNELTDKLRSDQFTVANVPARLERLKRDPWSELPQTRQSITASVLKRLRSL